MPTSALILWGLGVSKQHTWEQNLLHLKLSCKQALRQQRAENYNSAMGNLFLKHLYLIQRTSDVLIVPSLLVINTLVNTITTTLSVRVAKQPVSFYKLLLIFRFGL